MDDDLISRQGLIDFLAEIYAMKGYGWEEVHFSMNDMEMNIIMQPPAQPESKYEYHYDHTDCIWYRPKPVTDARQRAHSTGTDGTMRCSISSGTERAIGRIGGTNAMRDPIDRQTVIDALNSLINRFEQILRDIRETKVDDSVCGMCEYDGAYIGQSGDWYNECPGFDKEDCFELSDTCRKRWLESVDLPSAQPEQRWILVSERLPENNRQVLVYAQSTHFVLAKYDEMRTADGCYKMMWVTFDAYSPLETIENVIAWMPLPEPYREKGGRR